MSHAPEFAGRLRERIVIEAPVTAREATGVRLSGWQEVARCLAAIRPKGTGAEAEGMALSRMGRFEVLIRWREGIAVGQRVSWRGRHLQIRAISEDARMPDRLDLTCEEVRS